MQNNINGLISRHGDLIQDAKGMEEIIIDYFDGIFTSNNRYLSEMCTVLECVNPKSQVI